MTKKKAKKKAYNKDSFTIKQIDDKIATLENEVLNLIEEKKTLLNDNSDNFFSAVRNLPEFKQLKELHESHTPPTKIIDSVTVTLSVEMLPWINYYDVNSLDFYSFSSEYFFLNVSRKGVKTQPLIAYGDISEYLDTTLSSLFPKIKSFISKKESLEKELFKKAMSLAAKHNFDYQGKPAVLEGILIDQLIQG